MIGERPRIETRSGVARGRAESGVAVFRGVPYARAPIAELRWAPPEREAPWAGVLDAGDFGPMAPQRPGVLMRMLGMDGTASGEDCLTLNAWVPSGGGVAGRRRPVLVWLHGGGFTAGAGSLPVYDGQHLARRGDAVVVTVNYRLGALGFLAWGDRSGADPGAANLGLLDQIAALAWVREHADRFGGDPDNVTVFGESAGAMSIGALLGAPAARGLFQRAILQSGASHNVSPPAAGRRVAEQFCAAAGLPGADAAALRGLSVDGVLDAQQRVVDESWRTVGGLAFQPVVDGRVIPRAPLDAVADGAAREISLLVGTNLDEWNLFALPDAKLRDLDEAGLLRRLLRNPLVSGSAPCCDPEALAKHAIEVYRGARAARGVAVEPRALWLALQTDRVFRIPAIRLAERQCAHPARSFSYLFTWASAALGGALGSCHGLEVPFAFGTTGGAAAQLVGGGPQVERLAARIQDAWLAFARSGDPGWRAYDDAERSTMVLGRECGLAADPMGEERRFWEGLL
jgi:para-nitrobenzyl esterase